MVRPRRYGNGWSSVAGSGATPVSIHGVWQEMASCVRPIVRTDCDRVSAPGSPRSMQGGWPNACVERGGVPLEDVGPVVVVHGERAARGQVIADGPHRVQREEVALQAQPALPRDERQRVRQREQDQVVPLVRPLQERATVVDVHAHPRVLIGMVRMQVAPQPLQDGIDLDGVHVTGAVRERERHVVPAPGPDDQDIARSGGQVRVRDSRRRAGPRAAGRAAPSTGAAGCSPGSPPCRPRSSAYVTCW